MIEMVDILRLAHIVGAAVLLGTGAGIAFFMVMAHRSGEPRLIAHTAAIVVIADWLFTASAVVAQPVTGWLLAREIGWSLSEPWIVLSLALYVCTGLCWLPVVWMQLRIAKLAARASDDNRPLPSEVHKLMRVWFWCGWPAFAAVVGAYWLMIAKPS